MSVVIPDMPMPKCCGGCQLCDIDIMSWDDTLEGVCVLTGRFVDLRAQSRDDECPMIDLEDSK